MTLSKARIRLPEAGWRLKSKPGGPDYEDGGSGRKMALRIERRGVREER
jgi:hypothetical protein